MCEGDVDVLLAGLCGEEVVAGVDPGKANHRRHRAAVARVVEVHDVVGVLEGEPFVVGEERGGAEWRGASDYGLVAAKLKHGGYIGGSEVEFWGDGVESLDYGACVGFNKFLGYC